jgi:four helix bundle protein
MNLQDLKIYSLSLGLSDQIWKIVVGWDYFAKNAIGNQLVRAADSISANISEAYGRYHFKEQKQFLFYARGSLFETRTFVNLAFSRNLIEEQKYLSIIEQIDTIGKKLNSFINTIGKIDNSSNLNNQ